MRTSALIACALLSSCAYYEDRVADVGTLLAPSDERVVHGDTRCKGDVRAAAGRSYLRYADFTRGRIRRSVVWDLDESNYLDLAASAPTLKCIQRSFETANYGGHTEGDAIFIVPETCAAGDLDACIMHEVGHSLGFEHFDVRKGGPSGQVMSTPNGASRFGPFDWRECLRVRVCRIPDYTTVTVQVDPAIPPVFPEYPR